MEIRELFLQHYGKFENHRISLKPGVNVIYGGNETGKTTIHSFITAMLFGLSRARGKAARNDEYQLRQPWDAPGAFLGSMKIESKGQIYRIDRCFDRSTQPLAVTCESTLWESPQPEQAMDVLLGGVGEAAFSNTLCISQTGAETTEALAQELRRYMVNSDGAPGGQTDVSRALQNLRRRKKQMEQKKKRDDEALETRIREKQAEAEQLRSEIELLKGQHGNPTTGRGGRGYAENGTSGYEGAGGRPSGRGRADGRMPGYGGDRSFGGDRAKDRMPEYDGDGFGYGAQDPGDGNRRGQGQASGRVQDDEAFYRRSRLAIRLLLLLTGILCLAAAYFLKDIKMRIVLGICGILFLALIVPVKLMFRPEEEEMKDSENSEQSWQGDAGWQRQPGAGYDGRPMRPGEPGMPGKMRRIEGAGMPGGPRNTERPGTTGGMRRAEGSGMPGGYAEAGRQQDRRDHYLAEEIRRREEAYRKLQDELESLYQKHVRPEDADTEIAALTMAIDRICDLSSGIYAQSGRQVNERASEILSELTAGRYNRIWLDETAEVRIHTPSRVLGLRQVSGGTMQQIWFALRMAAAELLCGENRLPILLDEPFALYDDERLEAALRWLKNCGRQVILFTCQKREREILERIRRTCP